MYIHITKVKDGYVVGAGLFDEDEKVYCYDRSDLLCEVMELVLAEGGRTTLEQLRDLASGSSQLTYRLSQKLENAGNKKGK